MNSQIHRNLARIIRSDFYRDDLFKKVKQQYGSRCLKDYHCNPDVRIELWFEQGLGEHTDDYNDNPEVMFREFLEEDSYYVKVRRCAMETLFRFPDMPSEDDLAKFLDKSLKWAVTLKRCKCTQYMESHHTLCEECTLKEITIEYFAKKHDCPICKDDETPKITVKTSCGHIFHEDCLEKIVGNNCPMCRTLLTRQKFSLSGKRFYTSVVSS